MKNVEKAIRNLTDKQKIASTGFVDTEGFPNTKATLQPRKREGIRILHFAINTFSMRTTQYLKSHRACVYLCDSRLFRRVMLKGEVEALTDNSTKEMIRREGDTLYYPPGVIDPDYCILKFTVITGRRHGDFSSEDSEAEQAVFNLRS